MKSSFKKYRRKQIAELRPVVNLDIDEYNTYNFIVVSSTPERVIKVSISDPDIHNGSPKLGDMIARNPENHNDQWLVAEKYFKNNFELYEED